MKNHPSPALVAAGMVQIEAKPGRFRQESANMLNFLAFQSVAQACVGQGISALVLVNSREASGSPARTDWLRDLCNPLIRLSL